jgi:hypothetical protein
MRGEVRRRQKGDLGGLFRSVYIALQSCGKSYSHPCWALSQHQGPRYTNSVALDPYPTQSTAVDQQQMSRVVCDQQRSRRIRRDKTAGGDPLTSSLTLSNNHLSAIMKQCCTCTGRRSSKHCCIPAVVVAKTGSRPGTASAEGLFARCRCRESFWRPPISSRGTLRSEALVAIEHQIDYQG